MKYPKLFEEGKIGNLELKNRVVMTPIGCSLAESDGTPGEKMIRYYEERAKGGVGLIITEITRIDDETGIGEPNQLSVTHSGVIPQLKILADAVHAYDTKIFVQLHHPGNQTPSNIINGKQPVSASDVTCSVIGDKPRPLTTEEVKDMIRKFVTGAVIAQKAGIDGVELHGAHGYLLNQFMSPYTNRRTDEYGGSFTNRMRMITEIIMGIRAYCGPKFPISVRIDGEEYIPGGISKEEGLKIAQYLDTLPIDALNVSCGTYESGYTIVEPSSLPSGWKSHLAKDIKAKVHVPVIAVNTIKEPAFAEYLLDNDVSDFIGLGRPQLADPNWTNKALKGEDQYIRKCIGCLECFRLLFDGNPVQCTVNPILGQEYRIGEDQLKVNGNGRVVAVAGSGPAGMQAAKTLAQRGFKVTLFEKENKLGGTANIAAIPPHKDLIAELVKTQTAEIEREGVEVKLNTPCTVEEINKLGAEAVFDATGGTPIRPNLPGIEKAVTAESLLADESLRPVNKKVIVIGGGVTGLETAEVLSKNNEVTVVEMLDKVGGNLYASNLALLKKRLEEGKVTINTGKALTEITDTKITVKDVKTNEIIDIECDQVVLAMGVGTNRTLHNALKEANIRTIMVGDVERNGQIRDALQSAYMKAYVFE